MHHRYANLKDRLIKKEPFMKNLSKNLTVMILLTSLALCAKSDFWETIRKEMNDTQLTLAQEVGELFNRLPKKAKNSGHHITLTMPDCQSDTIVKIYLRGIAGIVDVEIIQVITLTPIKKSQKIKIPKPFGNNKDNIVIEIVKKTKSYIDYINFLKTHNLERMSLSEEKEWSAISIARDQEPECIIELQYATLKNNQTITLPYPATKKPTQESF